MLCLVGISLTTPVPATAPAPARARSRSRSFRAASTPRNDASLADQVPGGCSRAPDPTRESLVVSSTQSVPLLGAIRSSSLRPLQNWVFFLSRSCCPWCGYWVGPVSGKRLVSDHQCIQENGRFDERLVQSGGQEMPGTLSSLKLSGLEIGELTQHLGNFRRRISRSHGKRGRGSKSSPFGRQKRNYPSGDTF